MKRIAAFLLLAGLSQIPLWAGDYFMPPRTLFPAAQETPVPGTVVSQQVVPVVPPVKGTVTTARATKKVEPAPVRESAVAAARTVGVELIPPTGMGRTVSVAPPATGAPVGAVQVMMAAEKPAAFTVTKPMSQEKPAVTVANKPTVKQPVTQPIMPVVAMVPGTTVAGTEYLVHKATFAAPASVVPLGTMTPTVPMGRVLAPTRPIVPVQYTAPAPMAAAPAPVTMAGPAMGYAAPAAGGACPTCGHCASHDGLGAVAGRLRSWFLFQPTTRGALPLFNPTPYVAPILSYRCDGYCPKGSYWGGCNMPGHCDGPACGSAGGCATGSCGAPRAAACGAANCVGGRLGFGGACKTGCVPPADNAIAGYQFANGTQQVGGVYLVRPEAPAVNYPVAARTPAAPSAYYKPSYGTDAAPAMSGVAPASGNVLARPFTQP